MYLHTFGIYILTFLGGVHIFGLYPDFFLEV
jgi:hypothetical protein